MAKDTTKTDPDPKDAAQKLAAIIPSPDQATSIAAAGKAETKPTAPKKSSTKNGGKDKASAPEEDVEVEVGNLTAGNPAPPLQTMEVDTPPPTRRRKKTARKPNAASTSGAKKAVQKMLPPSVRVLIYKRSSAGQMAYVGDYSANDLMAQGTLERFLHAYVIDEYGYGEYSAYLQEPNKEPSPAGSITIAEPASHRRNKDQGPTDSVDLFKLMLERDEKARAEAANRKSPMEEMREMLTFFQTMTGADQEKPTMDPMLMFLMMQMNNRPEPPSGPDPLMMQVIERLERMEQDRQAAAMIPPPPPPPPQPQADPMDGMAKMMAVLSEQNSKNAELLLQAIQSNRPTERNSIEEYATLLKLNGVTDDRLSTKDLLGMLPTLKGLIAPDPGKSSISEALETLRNVKILEREFGGGGDQAAASFWDFLRDFIQSDAGTEIAKAITAKENNQKLEERHAERRRALEENDAQAQEEQEDEQGLMIPESFGKHAQAINQAATAAERVQSLIQGLQHLGMYPDFRPYMAKIIGLMKQNRKIECLEFIAQFLESLIEAGSIEQVAAQKSLEDLDEHWDILRQQLKMPDIDEVFPEGYEAPEGEAGPESDDDEEGEVDPPRAPRRNPDRDVTPPEPTPEQVKAREELERSRQEGTPVPAS